jgi:hypothetical protein
LNEGSTSGKCETGIFSIDTEDRAIRVAFYNIQGGPIRYGRHRRRARSRPRAGGLR